MENCIFCKIVKGEMPCNKVWEDKDYLAFLTIAPVTSGHVLIIPKKHTDYVFDLSDEEYSHLFLKAKKVANTLKSKTNAKKIGIMVEGFGVPHVHVHLIPINTMQEIIQVPKQASQEELIKMAMKLNEGKLAVKKP